MRTLREAALELTALWRLLDEGTDDASDEWVAAAYQAVQRTERRLRELLGPDDRAEPASQPDDEPLGEVRAGN